MSNHPYITLDATRNEAGALFIAVELFGYPLANFARNEEEQAFHYVYGFQRAALLAGVPEPLMSWNLDFEMLDAMPDYVGKVCDLSTCEAPEPYLRVSARD